MGVVVGTGEASPSTYADHILNRVGLVLWSCCRPQNISNQMKDNERSPSQIAKQRLYMNTRVEEVAIDWADVA
jgi:hypothetical protein